MNEINRQFITAAKRYVDVAWQEGKYSGDEFE